jgi:uncharacterized membrane protein (UPF0127 family)
MRQSWLAPLALLAVLSCSQAPTRAQWAMARGEVEFADGTRVKVEIADTPELRQRGLMFRESLSENEGMLFIFEETGFYPFWMKNTLIPLDMLWLDASRRVVSIAHSVPPCKADPCPNFSPTADALYQIEVVSGFAKRHQVREGDVLTFRGVPPARPAR